ncbi:MAG: hypothetical protein K1X78_15640 [Verrucomicrobiaceae bacterium]|nr:hypothetical protein [Verrucomicrobiaceae bacterium]
MTSEEKFNLRFAILVAVATLAIGLGNFINETIKSNAQRKLEYVRLAIGLIRPVKKTEELSPAEEARATAIRSWAVDILNKHSPEVPIPDQTKKAIIEGKFDKGWDFDAYSYDGGYDYDRDGLVRVIEKHAPEVPPTPNQKQR